MKTRKSSVVIALVVLVSVFVYYRYARDVFQDVRFQNFFMGTPKDVSADVTYETAPGKWDHLRFVVTVDGFGRIQNIQTLDFETGQIPEKKKEFNEQVNVILKGKKLSELSAIDKVGSSSLTTKAFNDSLGKLQAEL